MATMSKPRLLISGDSYMAWHGNEEDNPEEFRDKNQIHWAKQLEPYFDVENISLPGSTNASITYRLATAIKKQKPDYIVLGFTEFTRLEYSWTLTNVWPQITNDKSAYEAWHQYIKYADENYMLYKSVTMAEYAITLARSVAKTCFVNNLLTYMLFPEQKNFVLANQSLVNLYAECLPMQLTGHKEIHTHNHPDRRTYHVVDPDVHKKFSQCILDTFGFDTTIEKY